MKKMVIAMAMMACALGVMAETPYAKVAAPTSIGAAQLAYTNDSLLDATSPGVFKEVVKLAFKNDSAVTATFVTYVMDGTIATSINSSAVTAGSSAVVYPIRYVVPYEGVSNAAYHVAQKVRVIATLGGTNGAAVANALKCTLYAK